MDSLGNPSEQRLRRVHQVHLRHRGRQLGGKRGQNLAEFRGHRRNNQHRRYPGGQSVAQQAQRFANIAGHGRIGDIKPSRLHPPLQVLIDLSQAQRLSGIPYRLQQLGRHGEQFLEFVSQRRHQRRYRVLADGTSQSTSLGLEELSFLLRPAQLIAGIDLRSSLFAQVQDLFPAVSSRVPQHQVGIRRRASQVGF